MSHDGQMARVGTSGWSYDHWEDVLYHGVPARDRLAVYQREFDTVELNASFYRWPPDNRFSGVARPAARRVRAERQGSARPHARSQALRARGMDRAS